MKDKPLIISLLIGFIVILVIAGVSILVKLNTVNTAYNKKTSENISLQKNIEDLKRENDILKSENLSLKDENKTLKEQEASFKSKMDAIKTDMKKLEKLKEKLEDNLKEELMKDATNKKGTIKEQ